MPFPRLLLAAICYSFFPATCFAQTATVSNNITIGSRDGFVTAPPRSMRLSIRLNCQNLIWRGDHYDANSDSGVLGAVFRVVKWDSDSITLKASRINNLCDKRIIGAEQSSSNRHGRRLVSG
jgi:hypothetical protein